MEAGLYLHIPFCKSKCAYCDFASFAGQEDNMAAYAEKVQQEIRQKAARVGSLFCVWNWIRPSLRTRRN